MLRLVSFFIHLHFSLRKSPHSLSSPFLPFLKRRPSFLPLFFFFFILPHHPLPFFSSFPPIDSLGFCHTLNLLFLSEGGVFIRALSFPDPDLSIAELHLHTYCRLTPCAKYSFVKPSPFPCLHLVEIVFFQLQALLPIQAGL